MRRGRHSKALALAMAVIIGVSNTPVNALSESVELTTELTTEAIDPSAEQAAAEEAARQAAEEAAAEEAARQAAEQAAADEAARQTEETAASETEVNSETEQETEAPVNRDTETETEAVAADETETEQETEAEAVLQTVTVHYEAQPGGTVSLSEETVEIGSGDIQLQGSTAQALEDYIFLGWLNENGEVVSKEKTFVPTAEDLVSDTVVFTASFSQVSFSGTDRGVNVKVVAEAETFPAGTVMTVERLPQQEALAIADEALGIEDGDYSPVRNAVAVDISFWLDDVKIEPEKKVQVELTLDKPLDNDEGSVQQVVHKPDDEEAVVLEEKQVESVDAEGATFEADSFSIYALLETDAAHLSDFKISSMATGSAPWDGDDEPGNDSSATNNVIRSFDQLVYELSYETTVYGDQDSYQRAYLWFRFELPYEKDIAEFDTNNMNWMSTDEGYEWKLETEEIEGQKTQVLTCAMRLMAKPGEEGSSAIPGMGTATVFVSVYGASNGSKIQPTFYAWMDHNQGGGEYSWFKADGSTGHDSSHEANEVKKAVADEVSVSAVPRYNVKLTPVGVNRVGAIGTFDFDTGNDLAQNKGLGNVTGQLLAYGVSIQLYGDSQKRLKGVELPQGPITFDLEFEASYTYSETGEDDSLEKKTVTLGKENLPLLWSADGNRSAAGQQDERDVKSFGEVYAFAAAPLNSINRKKLEDLGTKGSGYCWNGGTWRAVQDSDSRTIHFTVDDYVINPLWFPHHNIGTKDTTTTYYNPADGVKSCWKACFSAGEVFLVVPHEDLVAKYGNQGDLNLVTRDVNLKATSVTGQKQEDSPGTNDAQRVKSDDKAVRDLTLLPPGTYNPNIKYGSYELTKVNVWTDVNTGDSGEGLYTQSQEDSTSLGSKVAIEWYQDWSPNGAEANTITAADSLIKFDDKALELDTSKDFITYDSSGYYNSSTVTYLYAYKPDGSGWSSDEEQTNTKIEDLVYSTSYGSLGTCVGVLAQFRNPEASILKNVKYFNIAYFKVKTDTSLLGHVAQTTLTTRYARKCQLEAGHSAATISEDRDAWFDEMVQMRGAAYYGYEDASGNTITDSFGKAVYTEDGTYDGGSGAPYYGDSLYLVNYKSYINNSVSQLASKDDTAKKEVFNLDYGEDTIDFCLRPSMEIQQGVAWDKTTTVTIVDTLPKELIYVPGTCVFGGTYVENEETGLSGSVTGGNPLTEEETSSWSADGQSGEITFTAEENVDGSTTLTWVITNVKVQEEVPSIYFKANFAADVNITDSYASEAVINTTEDQRTHSSDNGNYSSATVRVTFQGSVSLTQTLEPKFNEINTPLTWKIRYNNNSGTNNYDEEVMMVTLPHKASQGSAGIASSYHGTYKVSGFTVEPEEGKNIGDYTVRYTTDKTGYSLLSRHLKAEEVTAGSSGGAAWSSAVVSGTANGDGSYSVSVPENVTAIVIIGPFDAQKSVGASLQITPNENAAGDTYWNNVSTTNRNGTATVNVPGRVVKRSISGLVWYDDNHNGLRDSGEKLVTDIPIIATLYAVDDPTTSAKKVNALNTPVRKAKSSNVIEKVDVVNSSYKFDGIPEGSYVVEFTSKTDFKKELGRLNVTIKDVNDDADDTKDSDVTGTYGDDLILTSAVTDTYKMPAVADIIKTNSYLYKKEHVDMGLYLVKDPEITKKVNDAEHADLEARDEVFTYTVTTAVPEDENLTSFVIADTLVDELEFAPADKTAVKSAVTSVKIAETQLSSEEQNAQIDITGQKLTLTLTKQQLDENKGKEVTLIFTAKIKEGANLEKYIVSVKDGGNGKPLVPNKASYVINNDPKLTKETDEVTVTPPDPENPPIDKKVNGKEHEDLKERYEVFTYTVTTKVPLDATAFAITDTLVDELEFANTDATKVTIGETALTAAELAAQVSRVGQTLTVTLTKDQINKNGDKEIVVSFQAKIKEGANLTKYIVTKEDGGNGSPLVPNKASYTINNDPKQTKETDEVTVTPPEAENPPIDKKVNGKEHEDLKDRYEEFTYTITTKVPLDATAFAITDTLVDELEFASTDATKVTIGETALTAAELAAQVNRDGQKLTVTLTQDQINKNGGKEIVVSFQAKIKEGVSLTKYIVSEEDGGNGRPLVPNKASYIINDDPKQTKETDEVTVTPPEPENPPIDKKVNGKEHADLDERYEVFTYTVTTKVPLDATAFTITDTLVDELEFAGEEETAVTIDGTALTEEELAAQVSREDQVLTVKLTEEQVKANGDKEVVVTFQAKIRESANLAKYIVSEEDGGNGRPQVPNKASYIINDDPDQTKESNEVTVTPPEPENPSIDKKVNGKEHADLDERYEAFNYTVTTEVPLDATAFTITDTLVDELEFANTSAAKVTIGGTELTAEELAAQVSRDGQKLTVTLTQDQINKNGGKEIVVSFQAKIKEGVNLTKYIVSEEDGGNGRPQVPNTASYIINDDPDQTKESNEVTVTPPEPENPSIDKKVNDKEHADLDERYEVFTYTVTTKVPLDATAFTITDALVDELEFANADETKVTIDGTALTAEELAEQVSREDQVLTVKLTEEQVKANGDKEVVVTFQAKIRESANLAKYIVSEEDGGSGRPQVPNKASYIINDDPDQTKESNEVTVTPPEPDKPEIEKKINGGDHIDLKNLDEVFTYTITTKVPIDAASFTITDVMADALEFVDTDKIVVTIAGNKLSEAELASQVTCSGQTLTVELTKEQIQQNGDQPVVVTFKAKIRENAKLDKYESDGKISIPNTATYESLGDLHGSANSNTVTVTPPAEKETEKPGTPGTPAKTVKTGDDTPIGLWVAVLVIALAAVAGVVLFRRKKRK